MNGRAPGDLHQAVTRRITRRFFLRWHMAAILACVLLSGVVWSALLLRLGLRSEEVPPVLTSLSERVMVSRIRSRTSSNDGTPRTPEKLASITR